jgi:50S ribosomal subunit-associated GTPase HflX
MIFFLFSFSRATLEEVTTADILVVLCDRSNPVWKKQRETVYQELALLNCLDKPILEFWNKIDLMPNQTTDDIRIEMKREKLQMIPFLQKLKMNPQSLNYVHKIPSSVSVNPTSKQNDEKQEQFLEETHPRNKSKKDKRGIEDDLDEIFLHTENLQTRPISRTVPRMEKIAWESKYFIAAGSAKKNQGMDSLIVDLQKLIHLSHQSIQVFLPFSEDRGLSSLIHSQGSITKFEIVNEGTLFHCSVPPTLYERLKKFEIDDK